MPNSQQKRTAKVIPFERDGAFFLRRGTQRLTSNNLLDAVANYRQAYRREPDNLEYTLALAEALTQMQRYEQSNLLLLPLLSRERLPGECYFGIACNFIGQQQFDYAQDSLERYLNEEPEGQFALDAMDMLDAIESDDVFNSMPGIPTEREIAAQNACARGRRLMEKGEMRRGIALMEAAAARYPELAFVRNNLSMAFFCKRQNVRAITEARAVLEQDPDNVQAHCNLVLFLQAAKKTDEIAQELAFLKQESDTQDPDDLNRMAVTFMECALFEDALRTLMRLLVIFPYDEGAMHRMAVCCYQLGRLLEARSYYDRLLKINPDDTIAQYYRALCQKAIAGKPEKVVWPAFYQVPYTEVLRRVRTINDLLRQEQAALKKLWASDRAFRALLCWALWLPEAAAKQALLLLIAQFKDAHAARMLREFLLSPDQPDPLKSYVFMLLRSMHEREPYLAIIDGALVESRAESKHDRLTDAPACYKRVAQTMCESMEGERSPACIEAGTRILTRYLNDFWEHKPPQLNNGQVYAMAAALEYLACRAVQEEKSISKGQICSRYGISLVRLNNALGKLAPSAREEH